MPESESRWQGECFVFDQRMALNHKLEQGEYSLPTYIKGVQCVHCVDRFSDADRERFATRQRQIDQKK